MKLSNVAERFRLNSTFGPSSPGDQFGAFLIPGPCGRDLRVIASCGDEEHKVYWEHVSVSLQNRCPNWQEMSYIKDQFWDAEEVVMQLHPAKSTHISQHDYCLHLWRPLRETIPLPPLFCVGIRGVTHEDMKGMSTEAIEALQEIAIKEMKGEK